MLQFFDTVAQFFTSIWGFLTSIIDGLVDFILMLVQVPIILLQCVNLLPGFLIVSATALISIAVIKTLVGR